MKKVLIIPITCLIVVGLYYDWNNTLGICAGAAWGLINLYFIKQLVYCLLIAENRSYLKILIFTFVKFPLLYVVGYGLLTIDAFSPWSLLIGFSIILVVSTQIWFWSHLRTIT